MMVLKEKNQNQKKNLSTNTKNCVINTKRNYIYILLCITQVYVIVLCDSNL